MFLIFSVSSLEISIYLHPFSTTAPHSVALLPFRTDLYSGGVLQHCLTLVVTTGHMYSTVAMSCFSRWGRFGVNSKVATENISLPHSALLFPVYCTILDATHKIDQFIGFLANAH